MFPLYSIHHFRNQPEQRIEFFIDRIEDSPDPQVDIPHKHNFYEIMWVQRGASRQAIDYQEYQIYAGTLFFISPGQLHLFEEWDNVEGYVLMFTEEFFLLNLQNKNTLFELSYLDNLYAQPLLELTSADAAELQVLFDLLSTEFGQPIPHDDSLRALLLVLLNQIQRKVNVQREGSPSTHYQAVFKQLNALLQKHYIDNWPVSYYADALNITPHHLNTVTRTITGQTAGEIVRGRSILEAKRLLTFSDQTVLQIADQLGYNDSAYFARTFKRQTGLAPITFRQQMSQKYR